jgi:transcription antitermination factor NusG
MSALTRSTRQPEKETSMSKPMPAKSGSSAEGTAPWWALYTRHQHEKTVADMLSVKGFEVLLPLYDSVRRWKDRRKVLSLPLFPGYVFVRGGLERRLQIVSTPGIHMILTHGEKIATIPDHEMDAVRRTIDAKLRVEPHPFLRCGERVRVKRGALEGIEGILVRFKGSARLVLSVDMLAKSVGVEMEVMDVEPVTNRTLLVPAQVPAAQAVTFPLPPGRESWTGSEAASQSAARVG